MDQPLLGLQQSWFKHFKKWTLVIKQATTQNHPQPAKTTQNHHQLPKITHNQMVWTFHISGRKIFSLFQSSQLRAVPPPPTFIFKWGVCPMGGISFDGEGFKKIIEWGGGAPPPAPHAPPTMGNPAAGWCISKNFSSIIITLRSHCSQMFFKIAVPKIVANFTGKCLCWSLFWVKL